MDGENNGKPYEQMDDLGVTLFLETPKYSLYRWCFLHFRYLQILGEFSTSKYPRVFS